jgi:hypothetical protein
MTSQAAYAAEKAIGHDDSSILPQDVSNYNKTTDSEETMQALVWVGKNKVEVRRVKKPEIIEDGDVVLKVTGSTVCGSDLHLLHGMWLNLTFWTVMIAARDNTPATSQLLSHTNVIPRPNRNRDTIIQRGHPGP